MIALMVFAWGTHYKLSLYSTQHENSPAKVCTRGSDAAKSAVDHAVNGPKLSQEAVRIPDFLRIVREPQDQLVDWRVDEPVEDLQPLRRTPELHLRPPPDHLRSHT